MRITLNFPPPALEKIKSLGLRQRSPEKLRWTSNHPGSHYGIGVLLRGQSSELLDGATFRAVVERFDAWIDCDSEQTKKRVVAALALGTDDNIFVVDSFPEPGKPETISELGSLGGAARTRAKIAAARENGRLGGRPKKQNEQS